MLCHRSQLLWFRYLYITFSRYMFTNTFQIVPQGPKNLKIYWMFQLVTACLLLTFQLPSFHVQLLQTKQMTVLMNHVVCLKDSKNVVRTLYENTKSDSYCSVFGIMFIKKSGFQSCVAAVIFTACPLQVWTCLWCFCELACFLPTSPHKTSPQWRCAQFLDPDSVEQRLRK